MTSGVSDNHLTAWIPNDVRCPRCSTGIVYTLRKPYCPACFWNVENVHRYARRQVRNGVIGSAAFALVALVFRLGLPLAVVGLLGMVVYAINGLRLRRVPRGPVLSQDESDRRITAQIATPQRAIFRKAPNWKWKLAGHPLLLGGMCAVFGYWFYLDARGLSTLSKSTVVLWLLFAYILCTEVHRVIAEFRQFRLERRLAENAVITMGNVVTQEPTSSASLIHYDFRDLTGRIEVGRGPDLTGKLFEDMPLSVVFDPDQPNHNIPLTGMKFFTAEPQSSA